MRLFEINSSSIKEGIQDSANIHSQIDQYIDQNASSIEDWQDQARLIFKWLLSNGATKTITAKKPAQMNIDGSSYYLYRVHFVDEDGQEKWLAFESETGIAEITSEMPDPADFS